MEKIIINSIIGKHSVLAMSCLLRLIVILLIVIVFLYINIKYGKV